MSALGTWRRLAASCALAALCGASAAQTYPVKPIRIVTGAAGGGLDFAARLIAQGISAPLGQQVVVDNRGGPFLPGEIVASAARDGYTLLVGSNNFWLAPLIQSVPYDPVRDFSPITSLAISPSFLVVHPTVPAQSTAELIALAKAKPGALNYASGVTLGADHLAAELFKSMAGVDIVRVAYKGAGPALIDLLGGHVQLQFGTGGTVAPHIKTGRLRALAVTSARPSAVFPELPTIAATLPGYESVQTLGIWAPGGTPLPLIERLNREVAAALARSEIRDKFLSVSVETSSSTPQRFSAVIRDDTAKWAAIIKRAGIRAD